MVRVFTRRPSLESWCSSERPYIHELSSHLSSESRSAQYAAGMYIGMRSKVNYHVLKGDESMYSIDSRVHESLEGMTQNESNFE